MIIQHIFNLYFYTCFDIVTTVYIYLRHLEAIHTHCLVIRFFFLNSVKKYIYLEVPDIIFDNTKLFCIPCIFWIILSKDCKHLMHGRFLYSRIDSVFTKAEMFQYLGLGVYLFCILIYYFVCVCCIPF